MTETTSVPESPAAITSTSVVAFFAADYAALAPDGKVYANGALFSLLRFPSFPAVLATLGVGAALEVPFQDTMGEHTIRIGLRDPENQELPVRVEAVIRGALSWEAQFGDPALIPFGVTITNVEFPAPGVYKLVLWFDGVEQATYRMRIIQVPGIPSVGQAPQVPSS
jgi:hypothetical protein